MVEKYISTPERDACLVMMTDEDGYDEPYHFVTLNLETDPPEGTVWVKSYSEAEDIYKWLVKKEYLKPHGETIPSGYVDVPACYITDKLKDLLSEDDCKTLKSQGL